MKKFDRVIIVLVTVAVFLASANNSYALYNPSTGRFNRMDPFTGNKEDPQSLHKYAYCHNNPINNIDPSGNFTLKQTMVTLGIGTSILGIAYGPHIYSNNRDLGVQQGSLPKKVAIITGAFSGLQKWEFATSGASIRGLERQLRSAGHIVQYSTNPSEEDFVTLCNNNNIVLVIGHGPATMFHGEPGWYDQLNKPFSAFLLGGTQTHRLEQPVRGALTDITQNVSAAWVTANEIQGRINNPQLDFIAASCEAGKTGRMYNAIFPNQCGTYIGPMQRISGPHLSGAIGYVVDRVNGVSRNTAFQTLQGKNGSYVLNPTNMRF